MNIGYQDRELELITHLCRRLAALGLSVGMSDARPAAVIRTRNEPTLTITVDASGDCFEWSEGAHRHPVADPSGAAAAIVEYVKAQRSRPGGLS
ncbi:hypothetical protein Airi01_026610 [Actinoallomurus iriomotensis]|uniref:Uncharacterized protein n=1 Tax=Actinoallomurus iriomotensis TaxID=478107 RepID=A0A9W6VP31_9ACTN|nr:hypothetical protein Airi01_026610 [Actinoallomurus iriomotensis]